MINMMYLVLLALLALNVSKEILKSFHLMEVSFNRAKESLDDKIANQLSSLELQSRNDVTLKPYYNRALEAKRIANEFVTYIEEVKTDLTEKTGGRQDFEEGAEKSKAYEAELVGTDNMEVHANYFLVDDNGGDHKPGWKARELEQKINDTRTRLLSLLVSDKNKELEIDAELYTSVAEATQLKAELTAEEARRYNSWSQKYLENTPLAGVITLLTKIQSDAKSLQGSVTDVLNQGYVPPVTVSHLVPIVKPRNGSVVMNGGKYEAEIFLAAETKGNENDEYILESGNGELKKVGDSWLYTANATGNGNQSFNGVIKVKTSKGEVPYPFASQFQVFQGGATIALPKMNVLYIGVKNEISIGVPGIRPEDVQVSMQGGSISRSGSGYVAKCVSKGPATISVSARLSDGTIRQVGSANYKVKNLPKPEGMVGAIPTGKAVPKDAILLQRKMVATMGEEFMLDDIKYEVTKYSFYVLYRKSNPFMKSVNGGVITQDIKAAVSRANPGDRIIVDKIRANGPAGQTTLDPIMIEII